MKKIHITESQLEYLRKKLSESITVDATKETEEANGNINTAWQRMKSSNPVLSQQSQKGEITLGVNPDGVDSVHESADIDGKTITKRQIKEAKIKKLQENCDVYLKKNIK